MRFLSLAIVAAILLVVFGMTRAEAAKKGPPRLQAITLQQFQQTIGDYVKRQAGVKIADVQVDILDPTESVRVPAETVALAVRSGLPQEAYGRREFDVELVVDGKVNRTVRVTADVIAFVDAVVATRVIRVDDILQEEDVTIARTPVSLAPRPFLTDPREAIGRRSLRPLTLHGAISAAALGPPYLVRKGERVTIEAKRGGLLVQATGVTKAVGQVGQIVTVTNQDSGKDVRAKVVGPGLVRVEF